MNAIPARKPRVKVSRRNTAVYIDDIRNDSLVNQTFYVIRRKRDDKVFEGLVAGKGGWDRLRFITQNIAKTYTTEKGAIIAAHKFGFRIVKKPASV